MKANFFLCFLCWSFATFSYAQTEKINQFDQNGKKNGKWIVYLNHNWKEVKDSSRATFCKYCHYDHGTDIYIMKFHTGKNWKLESSKQQTGKLKLLDGEYKWIDKRGTLRSIHKFKNGYPLFTEFFHPSGEPNDYLDYTKKWNGQPYTYLVCQYKKGKADYYHMHNSESGWYAYGDGADSITIDTLKVIGDSAFVKIKYYNNGKLLKQCGRIFLKQTKEQTESAYLYHGNYTSWSFNGQKIIEGEYYYNKKIGQWKYWDEGGKEIIPKDSN